MQEIQVNEMQEIQVNEFNQYFYCPLMIIFDRLEYSYSTQNSPSEKLSNLRHFVQKRLYNYFDQNGLFDILLSEEEFRRNEEYYLVSTKKGVIPKERWNQIKKNIEKHRYLMDILQLRPWVKRETWKDKYIYDIYH